MKRIIIALILSFLPVIAHAGNSKIAALSLELSKEPLWGNGFSSSIHLPENATNEELLDHALLNLYGGADYLGKKVPPPYKIIVIEKVSISPYEKPYTAALIDCLGEKIILLHYEGGKIGWWSRKYSSDR